VLRSAVTPWYVPPTLAREGAIDRARGRGEVAHSAGTRRRGASAVAALALGALVAAGCGGPPRQDVDEPTGQYRVEVTEATFPSDHKLAKSSRMTISVRNLDTKTIPNLAVTVDSFDYREQLGKVEDPRKPIFVIDTEPRGGETAYRDTWALGALKPGQTKTFVWGVTAVEPRAYNIRYRVSAGLDGKAKAVTATGAQPAGRFVGTVSKQAPDAKVADSGEDIITSRARIEPRRNP
jgi:hypothetical protein